MATATEPATGPDRTAGIAPPSAVTWTPEQELAVTAGDGNLLVSAAAGSGKTAVLVERVIRLVLGRDEAETDPAGVVDVDRLLVVTFTEAAASEMRDRLATALRERLRSAENAGPAATASRLRRQSALLGRASISTLHAFCLSVCRRHFHRLGLDPAFDVLSEEEACLLQTEVLDAVFEEAYERADEGFARLVDAYGSDRGDEPLRETVLRLHRFSRSHPDPEGWLARSALAFTPPPGARLTDPAIGFGRRVIAEIESALLGATENIRQAQDLAHLPRGPEGYIPVLAEDADRLSLAARRCRGGEWPDIVSALAEADTFPRLPAARAERTDAAVKGAVRSARDKAKKAVKGLVKAYGGRTEEELLGELRGLAGPVRDLVALVAGFSLAYRRAKDERATLDFGDLEHFCLRALGGAEAARELRERYLAVLVDEYQDTNAVQEAVLSLVSRGDNLFLVGDVKQSIYRFRLAEPSLFQAKSQDYLPMRPGDTAGSTTAGRLLHLPHNFRSRRPIVEAVNFVFGQVMRKDAAEIDYGPDAELIYGLNLPDPPGGDPAVELHLVEAKSDATAVPANADEADAPGTDDNNRVGADASGTDDNNRVGADASGEDEDGPSGEDEDGPSGEDEDGASGGLPPGFPSPEDLEVVRREAVLIAARIQEMVRGSSPLQVWDKGKRAYRPAGYGDVAVLLRATAGLANLVVETFAGLGIPVYAALSTGYFAAAEVETALSLLRLIDNPRQDVPLAAILRSSIVGLHSDDLARIRLACRPGQFYDAVLAAAGRGGEAAAGTPVPPPVSTDLSERLLAFLRRLDTWRDAARRSPLSELLWRLYGETGFYAYVGGLPGGPQRQANLRTLHDRARLFDQFSRQGLCRFLRFIDRLRESEGDLGPPPPLGEGENAVRVMSIHRSKGLEFPIVFLAHLGKRINLTDTRGDLMCHRHLGLGPVVADIARRLKYPSLASRAVSRQNLAETVAEEIRCLYVAMTRARDALVLIGSRRNLPAGLAEWCLPGSSRAGGRLSPARIAAATTYLDWIVPAVASHPAALELNRLAGFAGDEDRAAPLPAETSSSRWAIRLWGLVGHGDTAEAAAKARRLAAMTTLSDGDATPSAGSPESVEVQLTREIRDRIAALEPLTGITPGPVIATLDWRYPADRLTRLAAKVSPTELKRLLDAGHQEEAAAAVEVAPSPLPSLRPAFLQDAPASPTAAERGRATHLLLQHADLSGPLDEESLARLAGVLAEREVMTPDQARAADIRTVARFFTTDLGRWLTSRGAGVRREVPFTVGLPVSAVYGPAAGDTGGLAPCPGEVVLVQGIIDALVDEVDGLTILDFKTDAVTAAEVPERAATYGTQVALYRQAINVILGRPVKRVWLCFLSPGVAIPAEASLPVAAEPARHSANSGLTGGRR
jgi:ATP-dependent helicase/nuclease subunit A